MRGARKQGIDSVVNLLILTQIILIPILGALFFGVVNNSLKNKRTLKVLKTQTGLFKRARKARYK